MGHKTPYWLTVYFPIDEAQMHCHGGTAIAIEAGLLSTEEIATVNSQMLENVRMSGMQSIGLTIYPTYPPGKFKGSAGVLAGAIKMLRDWAREHRSDK